MTDGGRSSTISYYGRRKGDARLQRDGRVQGGLGTQAVRYLAWDLGREKIRVNCISAGPMRTRERGGISVLRPVASTTPWKKSPLSPQRRNQPIFGGNRAFICWANLSPGGDRRNDPRGLRVI